MSFVLYRKTVHCPNCDYEGKAKIKGESFGLYAAGFLFVFMGFFLWPLALPGVLFLIIGLFKPGRQICPQCAYDYPIPLRRYQEMQIKGRQHAEH